MSYAVVKNLGFYKRLDLVQPMSVHAGLAVANKIADRANREFRLAGGTEDAYRVVSCAGRTSREVCWLGWELDKVPTA